MTDIRGAAAASAFAYRPLRGRSADAEMTDIKGATTAAAYAYREIDFADPSP
jgi:hypothetical protein